MGFKRGENRSQHPKKPVKSRENGLWKRTSTAWKLREELRSSASDNLTSEQDKNAYKPRKHYVFGVFSFCITLYRFGTDFPWLWLIILAKSGLIREKGLKNGLMKGRKNLSTALTLSYPLSFFSYCLKGRRAIPLYEFDWIWQIEYCSILSVQLSKNSWALFLFIQEG